MLFRLTAHPHKRIEQIVNHFALSFGHAPFYFTQGLDCSGATGQKPAFATIPAFPPCQLERAGWQKAHLLARHDSPLRSP
jgi:hypothetical protein